MGIRGYEPGRHESDEDEPVCMGKKEEGKILKRAPK
jgi:hypothetical protein